MLPTIKDATDRLRFLNAHRLLATSSKQDVNRLVPNYAVLAEQFERKYEKFFSIDG